MRREKGTSLNSASLTPKPLASSVYVHIPRLLPSQTLDISHVPFSLPGWPDPGYESYRA